MPRGSRQKSAGVTAARRFALGKSADFADAAPFVTVRQRPARGVLTAGRIGFMTLVPDAESFKRLVDGTARGPGPSLARLALSCLAVPYGMAVACRNAAYDCGLLPVSRAAVPVISIGNLTLGGTGKTPLVAWTAALLARHGRRPAIVSRGYGAAPGERSDEAAELAILLPGVPHVADRDRVAAVARAQALGADVVVLDDGFQHRRLARNLDIVAVDATDPFGHGRLFPRGLLREPLRGIARARAVVLTRASSIAIEDRVAIYDALRAASRGAALAWAEAEHRPVGLRDATGATRPLTDLRGRRVFAFAGIGNPAAFRGSLAALGAEVVAFRPLPDHHAYTAADLDSLARAAAAARAELAVTTLKDLVKIRRPALDGLPLAALEIAIDIMGGAEAVERLVLAAIAGRAAVGAAP
jgi:tetraacyldisaccharide 4'-kinase